MHAIVQKGFILLFTAAHFHTKSRYLIVTMYKKPAKLMLPERCRIVRKTAVRCIEI